MTNTDRQSGVFRITPVSPIHIGSGEALTPMDYVLDGKMYKVKDVRKYFEDHIDDPDTAMKAVRDGLPLGPNYVRYELSFYGERPRNSTGPQGRSGGPPGRRADKPMFQATQKLDPQMKKLMKQAQAKSGLPAAPPPPPDQPKDKGSEVREFIKDPFGKPYIPGSSLKGCLRTALAFVLSESVRPGPKVLNNIRSQRPERKEWLFTNTVNPLMFGRGATEDVLKAFIVRDSAPLEDFRQRFAMTHVKVMNIMQRNFEAKYGMPIYLESLMPGTGAIEIPFYVDLFRLKKDSALAEVAGGRTVRLLQEGAELSGALQAFSTALIDHEIAFYRDQHANNAVSFFEGLRRTGAIHLDLGFGTGWNAKTVGLQLEDNELAAIRHKYGRNREGKPNKNMGSPGHPVFPKTRKWAATAKDGYRPMGWFRLEIDWK